MATNQSKEDNRLQNGKFFHLDQRQKQPMSNLSLNNPPASANSRFDSQNFNKIFTLNRRSWTIRRSAGNRLAHWMRLLTLFSPFFSQRLNVQLSNQRLAYPPVSWSRRECPLEVKSRHFSGFFRGHQRLHIKVIFHWVSSCRRRVKSLLRVSLFQTVAPFIPAADRIIADWIKLPDIFS